MLFFTPYLRNTAFYAELRECSLLFPFPLVAEDFPPRRVFPVGPDSVACPLCSHTTGLTDRIKVRPWGNRTAGWAAIRLNSLQRVLNDFYVPFRSLLISTMYSVVQYSTYYTLVYIKLPLLTINVPVLYEVPHPSSSTFGYPPHPSGTSPLGYLAPVPFLRISLCISLQPTCKPF